MPQARKTTLPVPRKPRKGGFRSPDNRSPINGKNTAPKLSRKDSYGKPSKVQKHEMNGNSTDLANVKKEESKKDGRQQASPPHYMKIKSRKNTKDLRLTGSKKEITVVTINANGRGALGLTPRYKIDLIKNYLMSSKPDAIFFQDCIGTKDIEKAVEEVFGGKYESFFNDPGSEKSKNGQDDNYDDQDGVKSRSITGIGWNKERYDGTPLQLDDERLGEIVKWIKHHDLSVVKLDCLMHKINQGEVEDLYPSFIAVSWHGPDYDLPLRQRVKECQQFLEFLGDLRYNNNNIPLLVGGDFNMDMKSYDMDKSFPEFLLVPYRPISGKMAKDLRNTFLFTMDSLQVTETAYKEHHPEIFSTPFITIRLRSRHQIKLWAVVVIQRAFRKYLKTKKIKVEQKRIMEKNKRRWKAKISGESYIEHDHDSGNFNMNGMNEELEPLSSNDALTQDYEYARRKEFLSDPNSNRTMYDGGVGEIATSNDHRRRKFNDLKSVQERKREDKINETLMRSYN